MGTVESPAPGRDWIAIISRPTLAEFAQAFVELPVLEASVLANPIIGAPGIRAFFAATRLMYDRIGFTAEHRTTAGIWLEWQGSYRGLPVQGVTVLEIETGGAIAEVRLFHKPLDQLIAFATDLQHRLNAAKEGEIP